MLLLCSFSILGHATSFSVDDSYTVNQRLLKNQPKYPQLQRPSLSFSSNIEVDFNLAYVNANSSNTKKSTNRELNLDIFRPSATDKLTPVTLRPTVLLIHGGGWRSGSKTHMYALANKLAHQGYVAVPIEYRLSIEAAYPAGLQDINHAINWLIKNAQTYGIDTDNIFIAGGSSGGHMAALVGYSAGSELFKPEHLLVANIKPIKFVPAGVIVLDGVLDFTSKMGLKYENRKGEKSAAALWLGGTYQQIPKIWAQASPANYINSQSPPLLYISSGNLRFQAGLEQVKAKMSHFNIPLAYHQFDHVPHTFWLFDPWLSKSTQLIDEFINTQQAIALAVQ